MLKNYFTASIRSLKKKFGFTIVNVLGLSLGMATCLTIYLYVNYDLSYDDFQKDNVYRIALNRVYPEREVDYAFVPHSIAPTMVQDFPEVLAHASFFAAGGPVTIQYGDDYYIEEKVLFTDSTFFDVINSKIIQGDAETALDEVNSIVLTESTARKLFGEDDPIGKQLIFGNLTRMVTAVTEDYPANSHLEFDYLIPFFGFPFFEQQNWTGFSTLSYIELSEGTNPDVFMEKIPDFIRLYADGEIRERNGISYDEYIEAGNGYNYYLQNIKDIHLYSNLEGEIKANGNINYVYVFSIIAIFILTIACINFMNLSTARSTERGKEVGIRKVLGSAKGQLIGQFLTESTVVSLLSAIVAFLVVFLILPYFNEIASRPLAMTQILTTGNILVFVLIVLLVGLLAGLYPAFFISSFKPVSVLKGKLKNSKGGIQLRNILVVLQFAISIALVSSTILVYNQMGYLLSKPLGFDKDQVVVIENSFALNNDPNGFNWNRFETFRTELNNLSGVQSTAYTSAMPGDILPGFLVRVDGTGKESMMTRNMVFDKDLLATLDMKLLEGRFFSPDFEDSSSIVLNKSAVEKLGLTDAVGKKITHVQPNPEEFTIIGVVEDFHFQSLHVGLEPVSITSPEGSNQFVNKTVIKIDQSNIQSTMAEIEELWASFVPNSPFQSYFLDEDLERFYESEKATGQIFTIFTVLAIIIACIGLLGLSAFIINQKVKEIGVRKVLGASVPSIIFLLSRDFTRLIAIAAIIAIPASYYWMTQWLDNFAYAVGINWLAFVIAGGLALFIGVLTISLQSIKAALANPVESLRDE